MKGIRKAYADPVLLSIHNLLATVNRVVRALQLCEEQRSVANQAGTRYVE